jgi:hypothetical protein
MPTLLTFSQAWKNTFPGSQFQTTSTSFVTDTSLSFSLSGSKTVLVLYHANSAPGSTMAGKGFKARINVDGSVYTIFMTASTPWGANYPNRNFVFWVGTLGAGSHNVYGEVASVDGTTITIDERELTVIAFEGDAYSYVEGTTALTTSSDAYSDDNLSTTIDPGAACKMLCLYGASNDDATTQSQYGKRIKISVAGTDYNENAQSPDANNYAVSQLTALALSRNTSTTVKGRVRTESNGQTSTISRRQIGVLCFADTTLLDAKESTASKTVSDTSFADDDDGSHYAQITRTLTDTRQLLLLGVAHKIGSDSGKGPAYGIARDGSDRSWSRTDAYYTWYSNSLAFAWTENLAAASYTLQGRIAANVSGQNATITARYIYALWLATTTPVTGTGAGTIPAITAAATGKHGVKGATAAAISAISASGTGKHSVKGTGAATLSAVSASGVGKHGVKGTAAATIADLTGSAQGKHGVTAIAAATAPASIAAAIGIFGGVTGTAVAVTPISSGAAIGMHGVKGQGVAQLYAFTGVGQAKHGVKGAGQVTIPQVVAHGIGYLDVQEVTGEGAAIISVLIADGYGLTGNGQISVRKLLVLPEIRTLFLDAENRSLSLEAEDRTLRMVA